MRAFKTALTTLSAAAFVCLAGCGDRGTDTGVGVDDSQTSDQAPGTNTEPTYAPGQSGDSGAMGGDTTGGADAGADPSMSTMPDDPNATGEPGETPSNTDTPSQ